LELAEALHADRLVDLSQSVDARQSVSVSASHVPPWYE
jgi:hypothetical protein